MALRILIFLLQRLYRSKASGVSYMGGPTDATFKSEDFGSPDGRFSIGDGPLPVVVIFLRKIIFPLHPSLRYGATSRSKGRFGAEKLKITIYQS